MSSLSKFFNPSLKSGLFVPRRYIVPLFSSNADISHTGDTTNTILATYTLPGGMMQANSNILIHTQCKTAANAANATFTLTFGGNSYASYTIAASSNNTRETHIANRNSLSSQVGTQAGSGTGLGLMSSLTTTSVNTANAVTINFRVTLGNSADTFTLTGAMIMFIP